MSAFISFDWSRKFSNKRKGSFLARANLWLVVERMNEQSRNNSSHHFGSQQIIQNVTKPKTAAKKFSKTMNEVQINAKNRCVNDQTRTFVRAIRVSVFTVSARGRWRVYFRFQQLTALTRHVIGLRLRISSCRLRSCRRSTWKENWRADARLILYESGFEFKKPVVWSATKSPSAPRSFLSHFYIDCFLRTFKHSLSPRPWNLWLHSEHINFLLFT